METKRKYNSESRRSQAAVTKRVILLAAKRLFDSNGFDRTTIEGIAGAARVSAPTVYALFKSKEGVLRELFNEVIFSDRYRSLVDEAASCDDPRQALKIAAHITRMLHDAEESEIGLIRGASLMSPDLRSLEREAEHIRYERQHFLVLRLEKEKLLPDTLSSTRARDILWSLTSPDIYRMLVIEKEWSSDEYETWLSKTLLQTLVVAASDGAEKMAETTSKSANGPKRTRKTDRVIKTR
jgi:AcrR family transcriptional regulator